MLPEQPVTVAFGQTRRVGWDATISVDGVRYSVPHQHVDERVWVRWSGEELVVTVVDPATGRGRSPVTCAGSGAARRSATSITRPIIPAAARVPGERTPHAANPAEAAFLAIGDGAASWLIEAAAAGTARVRSKMAEAVAFAKLHGTAAVDQALGTAALAGRFADADLARSWRTSSSEPAARRPGRAGERHSLQPGTGGWAGFGATTPAGER